MAPEHRDWSVAAGSLAALFVSFSTVVAPFLIGRDAHAQNSPFFVIDYGLAYESSALEDLAKDKRLNTPIKKHAPLYLWTRIAGDDQALELLKGMGEMPIRHLWFVRCGKNSAPGSVDQDSDISVSGKKVDPEKWQALMAAFESEISINKANGQAAIFDWRTLSKKKYVPTCSYQVLIVDKHDRPLRCEQLSGLCQLEFRVHE